MLILLPNDLGSFEGLLPPKVAEEVILLDGLIAESNRSGRKFLSHFKTKKETRDIPIAVLGEHTRDDQMDFLLEPLLKGEKWGLISDAGMPCVADPGSQIVARARLFKIEIRAICGPSSIILAYALSGFRGSNFSFTGYLKRERIADIRRLERLSAELKTTQVFIEAPYRNDYTLRDLIAHLKPTTQLCVASNLTLPNEQVISQPVSQWKENSFKLGKSPAVFLIFAQSSVQSKRKKFRR